MSEEIIPVLIRMVQIYTYVFVGRIMLSWIPTIDRSNPILHFIHQLTEPVLEPVRRTIPPIGMMDFSPIVVLLGLHLLQALLARSVY